MPLSGGVGGGVGTPGAAGATGPLRNVATHAALKTTTVPATSGDAISVQGAASATDGASGLFKWIVGTRPTEDGIFTIWHNTDATGSFQRVWDGRNASYGWGGLSATATPTQHNTLLTAMAGLNLEIDKLYTGLNASLNVPAATLLYAGKPGMGFKADGTLNNILNLGVGANVSNLDLDSGITTPTRDGAFSISGTIQLNTGSRLSRLRIKNARSCAIAGYNKTDIFIDDVVIDGAQNVAIFTQICNDMKISRVRIKNSMTDGIKIHTRDGTITNVQGYRNYVRDCTIDYTGVTLGGNVLAIEFWGGQTMWQNNPHVSGCDITGPDAVGAFGFWGISMDTVLGGVVQDCRLDGGPAGFTIALEAAGCRYTVFSKCWVTRGRYSGVSISQSRSSNITVESCTFRDWTGYTGNAFAIQATTGQNHIFRDNFFRDAGNRYIFLNGAGSNSLIAGNRFTVSQITLKPTAIYLATGANYINVSDNNFGPLLEPGETGTAFNIKAGDIGTAQFCVFSNNFIDGATGAGVATNSDISSYGGGGNHLFEGNRTINNSGAALGMYDGGPASVFSNNFCTIASTRTGGIVDLMVGRNS